ncbi:hypothetical protein N4G41_00190 [Kosakonia sacchari]|uniref:hypothetical protein n=1 Tax=Kosakonia sacchari TaxID=1158459 RepID=UPI002ACDB08D|nr:hypothetical protein [Kosakonia sacchari]MDZ7320057.1 hypothetical protein [Kosakonia sacchari]
MYSFIRDNYLKSAKIIMSAFMFLLSGASQAFQWPVLDDVTVELTSSTTATYRGNWSTIDIDEQYDGNGLQYIGIIHRHIRSSDQMLTTGTMSNPLRISSSDCPGFLFSCIGPKWIQANGTSGSYTLTHSGGANGSECVGISSLNTRDNATWASARHPVTPATTCLGTPPANQWCAMVTPSIEFNYGNLTLADAAGSKLTKPLQVECTDGMQFVLRLRGVSYISLSNGMHAELSTDNDAPLGTTLNGQQGINNINLTSTLTGQGVPGSFSGQGILFVSYP